MSLPLPLEVGWRATRGHRFVADGKAVQLDRPRAEPVMLRPPTAALAERLVALNDGGSERSLAAGLGAEELARLHYYVLRLADAGAVAFDVGDAGRRMVTLVPRRRGFRPGAVPNGRELGLSRFAYLRRGDGNETVLAAPDAGCEAVLADPQVATWLLSGPYGDTTGEALLRVLAHAGLLQNRGCPEPTEWRTWEFHDRLLHRASRWYEDFLDRGGTYRFGVQGDPTPALRPRYPGALHALRVPDVETSRSLRDVMEARRSQRDMSGPPPTADEIAELLYRVARTTEVIDAPARPVRRPYPSGGALHELEFYVAVGECDGLASGLYHYRGEEHELVEVADGEAAAPMLELCAQAWGQPEQPPPVLLVLASRLPRLAWKYERIAYRLTLMHAGVVIANLYLIATDMGLACCAAGTGSSEAFVAATGTSDWVETSVAEVGVGRRASITHSANAGDTALSLALPEHTI